MTFKIEQIMLMYPYKYGGHDFVMAWNVCAPTQKGAGDGSLYTASSGSRADKSVQSVLSALRFVLYP
jgi:hypothetical protein